MKKKEILLPFLTHPAYQKIAKIMKLTCAFMLILSLHVSAGTYSQDRITLKLQAADIKKALNTIERKSSYRFLYNEALVAKKPKINLDVTDEEVTTVLDQIFLGSGIAYRIMQNKLIVLKAAAEITDLKESRVNVLTKNWRGIIE